MSKVDYQYACTHHTDSVCNPYFMDITVWGTRDEKAITVKNVPKYRTTCNLDRKGALRYYLGNAFINEAIIDSIPEKEIEYEDYLALILRVG